MVEDEFQLLGFGCFDNAQTLALQPLFVLASGVHV